MTLGAYATVAQYKERRGKLGMDSRDTDANILIDLNADAEFIDSMCYRTFHKMNSDTRLFNLPSAGRNFQYIGDYATISAVTLDDEPLSINSDYWLRRARDSERFPYAFIEFDKERTGALKVTGERGWETVPDTVMATNCELTALRRYETPMSWVHRDTGEDALSRIAQKIFEENLGIYVRDQAVQVGFGTLGRSV